MTSFSKCTKGSLNAFKHLISSKILSRSNVLLKKLKLTKQHKKADKTFESHLKKAVAFSNAKKKDRPKPKLMIRNWSSHCSLVLIKKHQVCT